MKIRWFFIFFFIFSLLHMKDLWAIEPSIESDPDILLEYLLAGGNASNPAYKGDAAARGIYTNDSSLWGIGPGIVLSTGNIADYGDGLNTSSNFSTDFGRSGDSDLATLSGYSTYDASTFGFDFRAASNKISFDFVFGSEEYKEYVGSAYNDAFGAWLTDSTGRKTQLARDKQGQPITVNTAWMKGGNPPNNYSRTELDGITPKLTLTANVTLGQTYNMKLGIADASDHVFDSTAFISNFKGADSAINDTNGKLYGLFVGVNQIGPGWKVNIRVGDLASRLDSAFKQLPLYGESIVLAGDMDAGNPITALQIKDAIDILRAKMSLNDKFFLYIGGHGGSLDPQRWPIAESTLTPTNEYIALTTQRDDLLTDDTLYSYLTALNDIEKWIFIDACHSGGFWGNHNPSDLGDLEKLNKLAFFAAASENDFSFFWPNGIPIFGSAVEKMFLMDQGYIKGDKNKDGILELAEITDYLGWLLASSEQADNSNGIIYEMGFGDPVLFSPELINPVHFMSDGFNGTISYPVPPDPTIEAATVPEPGTWLLMGAGLAGLAAFRQRFARK